MPITKTNLNTQHLSLYLEEDRGIVFDKINNSVFHLPTLSVAILLSIDAGDSQQTTLNNLAKECQLPIQQLKPIYKDIKRLFTLQKQQLTYLDGRYPEFAAPAEQACLIGNYQVAYFKIANTTFSIDTSDKALFSSIGELLSPCLCHSTSAEFVLSVIKKNDCFELFSNGILVESELDFKHVVPIIIDRLQILAFQNSDYTFCFHGAAIRMPNGMLLLPGKSGSGKSTLSAILAKLHGNLFSDEIIAFDKHFQLSHLSLPIAVKSGSWESLSKQYPNLVNQQVWHRLDGRKLKYIWPNMSYSNNSKTQSTNNKFLIINPQFLAQSANTSQARSQANAIPLNVIDTISMLTQSGYQLGFELNEARLEEFLNFIIATPCYHLSYTSSQQALDKLDELWKRK